MTPRPHAANPPSSIHLGFELGSGEPVSVPLGHMAVAGMTQQAGKTTALEALASRSSRTTLAFITKRGERAFSSARQVQPYFRDRADWQFVTSIIDATLQEKNKFLRPWIIKICRSTQTLREVWGAVRAALPESRGMNHGVYTQLDAYLEMIVPEIERAQLASSLTLFLGHLNVMDVSSFSAPMQTLFIQSALDEINDSFSNVTVIIPEAWETIPQQGSTPVKASAIALVRKGASLGNFIWIDSQDLAGVDKTILRGCTVWLLGVQREANEIKRNLANIPAGIAKPAAADISSLSRGQFYACFGNTIKRVLVQPVWGTWGQFSAESRGTCSTLPAPPRAEVKTLTEEDSPVKESEACALRAENADLKRQIEALRGKVNTQMTRVEPGEASREIFREGLTTLDVNAVIEELRRRATTDPQLIRLIASVPAIELHEETRTLQLDASSLKGRLAKLIVGRFLDQPRRHSDIKRELERTGAQVNGGNLSTALKDLVKIGFLTAESGGELYAAVEGMKVNVVRS